MAPASMSFCKVLELRGITLPSGPFTMIFWTVLLGERGGSCCSPAPARAVSSIDWSGSSRNFLFCLCRWNFVFPSSGAVSNSCSVLALVRVTTVINDCLDSSPYLCR